MSKKEEERIYGFGHSMHSFEHSGKKRLIRTTADPLLDDGRGHSVMPFYLSTENYGFLLNTSAFSHFDVGASCTKKIMVNIPGKNLDFFLIFGKDIKEVIANYIWLTGKISLPKKKSLGFWFRAKSEWNEEKVLEVARKFREEHIPCDIIGLEPGWQTASYPCSFVWNRGKFKEPASFIKKLEEMGFEVSLWEHAYISPKAPFYKEIAEKNLCADSRVWGGLVPDFSLPETCRIFKDYHHRAHMNIGVGGYKLDECDGADFTGEWFFPDETKFPSGVDGKLMHNVFGFLYQKCMHSLFAENNRRSTFLVRAFFTGIQHYSSCLYSDLYDFNQYLLTLVNSSFSGGLWCPEARESDTDEEFIRRSQLVFFSPIAVLNSWSSGALPYLYKDEVKKSFIKYGKLRMSLLPYIYSEFYRSYKMNVPFIRALVLEYPQDGNTHYIQDQYFFGESIMVCPLKEGRERKVYFPRGRWFDFWTDEEIEGKQWKMIDVSIDKLPIYVRSGSIIPMGEPQDFIGQSSVKKITLHLYGENFPSYLLYDDDGETLDYLDGRGATFTISPEERENELVVSIYKKQKGFSSDIKKFESVYHGKTYQKVEIKVNSSERRVPN